MSHEIRKEPRAYPQVEPAGFDRPVQEFEAYLRSRGYADRTISLYQDAAVHFAFWVARKRVDRSQVTGHHIASFLQHLTRCRCPLGGGRHHPTIRAALRHFAAVLDAGGHRPQPHAPLSAVEREVQRFDDYLHTVCGVQAATRTYRRRYLREFLQALFGDGPVDPWQLVPTDVVGYLSRRASRVTPGSAKVMASSLRSYFRCLQLHGACDERLILAVPAPAHWKLAPLPTILTDDEVRRLLATFPRGTATGRRDYAIARCLLDLGLRAGEVAALRLKDIDWRAGTLRIAGSKSRRDDVLPMPTGLGRAIVAYLRTRGPATSRHVFLRVRPPVGYGATSSIVRNVIRRAAARAGIGARITGTRILRQTAASRMVRHGASLKDVADVLRHRSLDTTAIYTKVDLPRLATVAAPWPQEDQS